MVLEQMVVIVITTKKGTKGRVKVSFSSQVGVIRLQIQLMC
jgi:hypothetical protein